MNITDNEISSTKPAIIISPFKEEYLNTEFNPSQRLDIRANLLVGATKDGAVIYFEKVANGTVRLAAHSDHLYVAINNPVDGIEAPTGLGTLHAKEIIVQRPMFATMEDAQAVLEPGREFVTPDGTIKQVI